LDWIEGQFLNLEGTRIMCATHGAEFQIKDGLCVRGPCRGDVLTKVACTIEDGVIIVPAAAGFEK
jgi:nitrite reductase/ring-hydroxylating ferredoxin subunit